MTLIRRLPEVKRVSRNCSRRFGILWVKRLRSFKWSFQTLHWSCKYSCSASLRNRSVHRLLSSIYYSLILSSQIQEYMEQLLNKGASLSTLAFLRILQMVHLQVSSLVEDLKVYELTAAAPRSPNEASAVRQPPMNINNASASSANLVTVSLSSMLETAMEELFVPYTEGTRYLERESKSLGELYSSYLTRFARYHVSRCLTCNF